MGNLRKHRNNRLVTTEVRRNCFVSESSYDIKTFFSEYLLAIEIKKKQIFINKQVYLGISILENSKIVMYEF